MNSYNAINHLASADHLKNLKHCLWKYGGGMDRLDTFRISEPDVAKVLCYSIYNQRLLNISFPWDFRFIAFNNMVVE